MHSTLRLRSAGARQEPEGGWCRPEVRRCQGAAAWRWGCQLGPSSQYWLGLEQAAWEPEAGEAERTEVACERPLFPPESKFKPRRTFWISKFEPREFKRLAKKTSQPGSPVSNRAWNMPHFHLFLSLLFMAPQTSGTYLWQKFPNALWGKKQVNTS